MSRNTHEINITKYDEKHYLLVIIRSALYIFYTIYIFYTYIFYYTFYI